MTGLIRKCIEDVVPTVTIRTSPNQKPWIDGSIHIKLKVQITTFNNSEVVKQGNASHVANTDGLLQDKVNTRFEEKTQTTNVGPTALILRGRGG
jgi:hypothetical protein